MNPNSNVTPIESKQPAPATAKFTITAVVEGFPVSIEIIDANADKLRAMIDRLKAIGAEPPSLSSFGRSAESGQTDAPVCEFHGAMKRSNHGGFYCLKKMGDGSYCKSKG